MIVNRSGVGKCGRSALIDNRSIDVKRHGCHATVYIDNRRVVSQAGVCV